jgi:hypothetical protein
MNAFETGKKRKTPLRKFQARFPLRSFARVRLHPAPEVLERKLNLAG